MKVLESSKFKILSDRFIGVYFDKTKQIAKEGEEDLNVNYWQIYDAKTCVVYPDKFSSLLGFEKDVGLVQGFDDMYKYIKIENGKCRYLGIENERIGYLKNYKNAALLVENFGVVENKDGSMSYVFYNNNEITQFPQKYKNCYLPSENYGIVEDYDGTKSFVHITAEEIKPISRNFLDCKDVKEGVARVRGCSYDSSEEVNKRWHYALINGENITVLPDSFSYCYPIKDGIGRVVNDDQTMSYVKIVNNEIEIISNKFKDCFDIKEGVCRVRHNDDTFSLFKIGKDSKLEPIGAREYNRNLDKTFLNYSFPNCQDIQNNTTVIVNKDKETVSYATYENGELNVKAKTFKNAYSLKDNVGKVEYAYDNFGYVYNDNGKIIDLEETFPCCRDFSEGMGVVRKKNAKYSYVKIASSNNQNKKFSLVEIKSKKGFPLEFLNCEDYKNGFGIVQIGQNRFAILDKNGIPLEEKKFMPKAEMPKIETRSNSVKSISDLKKEHQAKRDRIHDTFFSR